MKTSIKLGGLLAVSAALIMAGAVAANAAGRTARTANVGQQATVSGTLGTFCGGA